MSREPERSDSHGAPSADGDDRSGSEIPLHDLAPERESFLRDVIEGLSQPHKQIPCKYFYDERGSGLFERICELDEYYPTRTELGIMRERAGEMAGSLGPGCLLVEYGSGSSAKTRLLLAQLREPAAYVPVDISREHLVASATALDEQFPDLEVLPVCADFTGKLDLPRPTRAPRRHVVYFPGSTIGNFTRPRAVELLRGIRALCGSGGGLLIGVDLVKDRAVLERAYDDREGVTRDFNLNLLARINRELDADFALEDFAHRAVWAPDTRRIEMHLVSRVDQRVRVDGRTFSFAAGESICTEHSHKYRLADFAALAGEAGLAVERVWTDPERLFSVQYLEAR